MATDTTEQIIGEVQAIVEGADPHLATIWVRDAARRSFEQRHWSFLLKRGLLTVAGPVTSTSTSSTVSINQGEYVVTFSSGLATSDMVGRQFRATVPGPIYEITGFVSATQLAIYPAWADANITAQPFSIFQAYVPMPQDFLMFMSVVDVRQYRKLNLNVPQSTLDWFDPQRNGGFSNPVLLSPLDYSASYNGKISQPVRVQGSGNAPAAGGSFSGSADALYTVQVTTGGVGGTAVFKWCKDNGAYTTGVTSDPVSGNDLADGVSVMFYSTTTYTLNDIFVIRATPVVNPGVPRMEIYPYPTALTQFPFTYVCRYPDITDDNVTLPGLFGSRGDVIREKALEFAATYPGTDAAPNTYGNQINRRDYHAANWKALIEELGRQDNEIFQRNVQYDPWRTLPYAPLPWLGADYWQTHDPAEMYAPFYP